MSSDAWQYSLTKRVQTEIVQSLSTSMMVIRTIQLRFSKLIETYPTLRDDNGSSGYVTYCTVVYILSLQQNLCIALQKGNSVTDSSFFDVHPQMLWKAVNLQGNDLEMMKVIR